MEQRPTRNLITELTEEVALLFGGIVSSQPVADDVVWRFMRGLGGLRKRFLDQNEEAGPAPTIGTPSTTRVEPHPAIERFLRTIREEDGKACP